jgi:hypothetical protein
MRGTFVLRISVAGTPFDYGRLIASCYPWIGSNQVYSKLFGIGSDQLINLQRQYLSQGKHSTIIDLKENRPVDIELPYISPIPVGRLFDNSVSVLAAGDSFDDFDEMWTAVIRTLNVRKCVSATPSNLSVYVYAYMKNVELGVPTGTNIAITTQSGTDERVTGPVQRVASNLLSISSRLHDVPYIGLYARASSYVLGGIKGIASLFGWSSPVIISTPHRTKQEPYQNGTNLIQHDTGQRITLDPKQELAISTEYVGVEKDELVVSDFCARQSFVRFFNWSAGTAPMSPMFYIPIHPRVGSYTTTSPSNTINALPTPMHHISQMFGKWHGKIVITLEVVCSAFHRGKLLVLYEPNAMHTALVAANLNLNKQYAHVWDIQETQRYSLCVEWNAPRPWLNNCTNAQSTALNMGTSFTPSTWMFNALNGVVIIAPLTRLTSPDNSDISINVYVHGEDMRFNRLTAKYMPTNRAITYNSGIEVQSGIISHEDEKIVSQVDSTCIAVNPASVAENGMDNHFYGESPISVRSLFKRFVTTAVATVSNGTTTAPSVFYCTRKIIPNITPSLNGGSVAAEQNPLSHMRYCFHAIRGSLRKRINIYAKDIVGMTPLSVTLSVDTNQTNPACVVANLGTTGIPMQMDGSAKFVPLTNGGIEVEIPFYNNNYYLVSSNDDAYFPPGIAPLDTTDNLVDYTVYCVVPASSDYTIRCTEDTATGEDFQMSYFLGTPPFVVV